MNTMIMSGAWGTVTWVAIPLFLGFVIYLLPKLDKYLALGVTLISAAYGWQLFGLESPLTLELLDNFGVTLLVDRFAGYFILTNALVTAAVILYCWQTNKTTFFYTQLVILHGSVNAAFASADFISLYVALEVISIAVFLLIAYPRSDRSIWVALRYLFVGNTAMLLYLMGAVLVYQANHSFQFVGLGNAPKEAIALILLGLLSKGGIFISGWWLPMTHAQSETPVSAILSGIVIKSGVFPLLRFALLVPEIAPIISLFGVATALLGVVYACWEKDTKRTLALSTISQLGWIMITPEVGGLYALAHGAAKAALFLIAGTLPSRKFEELRQEGIDKTLWLGLTIAGLSISGFPLLVGFSAKILALKSVTPWQWILMNTAAVGTAIVYAKFIFLPPKGRKIDKKGIYLPVILLIIALVAASGMYLDTYNLGNLAKALVIIGVGWGIYYLIVRRFTINLPRVLEQLEHLMGMMTLMLILLLGVLAR